MRVGIIGRGIVGNAWGLALSRNGKHEVHYVDPNVYGCVSMAELIPWDPAVVYVCVPTPYGLHHNDAVDATLTALESAHFGGVVAIRSTINPVWLKDRLARTSLRVVGYPEFLDARTAVEDAASPKLNILGGDTKDTWVVEMCVRRADLTLTNLHLLREPWEAFVVKQWVNTFFALKNALSNAAFDLCKWMRADWCRISKAFASEPRVGPVHTLVPGHDGKRGFGGACLPKDSRTFGDIMAGVDPDSDAVAMLDAAQRYNKSLRDDV